MPKYTPIYRCLLCNDAVQIAAPVEANREDVEKLLEKIISRQVHFESHPDLCQVPSRIQHNCKLGSLGVAHFAGFLKVE